jgi:hypothetical protein
VYPLLGRIDYCLGLARRPVIGVGKVARATRREPVLITLGAFAILPNPDVDWVPQDIAHGRRVPHSSLSSVAGCRRLDALVGQDVRNLTCGHYLDQALDAIDHCELLFVRRPPKDMVAGHLHSLAPEELPD